MNNYPVWWDTTVTIYNKFEDPTTHIVMWFRHTANDCFWKSTGNKVTINDVTLDTNNIICRIPKDDRFLEKHDWVNKPNNEMGEYFTLSPGDIIIKGAVEDIINEYTSGSRSSDIVTKYKALQGCLEVQQVAINTGLGRCNEHYFVKGI